MRSILNNWKIWSVPMYEQEFFLRLTELRMKKGVSARDMSLSIGQNSGYINHIENRQAYPSLPVFFNICEYLGVSPSQFFSCDTSDPACISELTQYIKKLNPEQLHCLSVLVRDLAN